jgi:serine/arginine repetitive matrix protein 1
MILRFLKVQIDVIKSWVKRRIDEMIGDEDDVVVNMTLSLLDQDHQMNQSDKRLDPKDMQVYLTGKNLNL